VAAVPPEECFEFPCDHLFKVFGPNDDEFVADVCSAIAAIMPVSRDAVTFRPSSGGAHQCVSVLVMLPGFTPLQQIYAALKEVPRLKFLL
jgi:putative lipoic acid-binding regulatory protein